MLRLFGPCQGCLIIEKDKTHSKYTISSASFFGLFAGPIRDLADKPPSQISFLDGLRTLAILLVMNGHFSDEFIKSHGGNFYSNASFVANGWVGVDLFFVLSGFFIGGQLWKELRATSNIHIGRFLLRRGLRIWPLYYFTYLMVLILTWPRPADKGYGWASLLFVANYFHYGIVLGGWTLSTEEQFYVLAPVLLYLLARKTRLEAIRPWLWGILAFLPLMRLAIWVHSTGHLFKNDPILFADFYYKFHTHCDGLIMGLILSNLWVTRNKSTFSVWKSYALVVFSFAVFILLHHIQKQAFDFSGLAIFFGSLVWFGLTSNVKWFNPRIFYWISRLSFGMYLNHEYMVPTVSTRIMPVLTIFPAGSAASQLLGMFVLTILSMGVSLITFSVVEYPFLQLRARLLGPHPA
jgi:peptidoglycan/LPS O-acetylase OafA/YrhL